VALSFVRTAEKVLGLKDLIRELSALGRPTPVTADPVTVHFSSLNITS
jgi:hypothetical protein